MRWHALVVNAPCCEGQRTVLRRPMLLPAKADAAACVSRCSCLRLEVLLRGLGFSDVFVGGNVVDELAGSLCIVNLATVMLQPVAYDEPPHA